MLIHNPSEPSEQLTFDDTLANAKNQIDQLAADLLTQLQQQTQSFELFITEFNALKLNNPAEVLLYLQEKMPKSVPNESAEQKALVRFIQIALALFRIKEFFLTKEIVETQEHVAGIINLTTQLTKNITDLEEELSTKRNNYNDFYAIRKKFFVDINKLIVNKIIADLHKELQQAQLELENEAQHIEFMLNNQERPTQLSLIEQQYELLCQKAHAFQYKKEKFLNQDFLLDYIFERLFNLEVQLHGSAIEKMCRQGSPKKNSMHNALNVKNLIDISKFIDNVGNQLHYIAERSAAEPIVIEVTDLKDKLIQYVTRPNTIVIKTPEDSLATLAQHINQLPRIIHTAGEAFANKKIQFGDAIRKTEASYTSLYSAMVSNQTNLYKDESKKAHKEAFVKRVKTFSEFPVTDFTDFLKSPCQIPVLSEKFLEKSKAKAAPPNKSTAIIAASKPAPVANLNIEPEHISFLNRKDVCKLLARFEKYGKNHAKKKDLIEFYIQKVRNAQDLHQLENEIFSNPNNAQFSLRGNTGKNWYQFFNRGCASTCDKYAQQLQKLFAATYKNEDLDLSFAPQLKG